MGAAAAVVGLVLSVAGTKMQMDASKDAAKEQEKIRNQQQAVSAQQRIEEKRTAARRARVARARLMQSAENSGVGTGSGIQGSLGSLETQAGAERLGISVREDAEKAIARHQDHIAEDRESGQMGQALGSIGGSLFSAGGGFSAIGSIFSIPQTTLSQGGGVQRTPDAVGVTSSTRYT
jgi:hypothetical protein